MADINLAWFHAINDMAGRNFILDTAMIFSAKYIVYIFGVSLVYLWFARSKYRQEALFADMRHFLDWGLILLLVYSISTQNLL